MRDIDNSIVLDIYDTVLDQSRWPVVLERVARAVGARGCMIFEMSEDATGQRRLTAPYISESYDRPLVDTYIDTFNEIELADQDVFARYSAAGDGIDLIGDSVLAPDEKALAARPNAQAMTAYGIHHRAGALLSKDQPSRDRFSLQFSKGHGPLGSADLRTMSILLPHIAKACELARPVAQLASRARGLAEALDRFQIGICLIRADRQIVTENAEFRRQRDATGVFRRTPKGALEMLGSADQAWFSRLIGDAQAHGQFGARPRKEAMVGRATDRGGLAVEIAPLMSADSFGEPRLDGFAIYSLDTAKPLSLDVGLVADVLSLTTSEAALIELLAEGMTNKEIAARRDRSVETVNSQVKSMLSKTDCANRTQLIRMVTNIGANFLA